MLSAPTVRSLLSFAGILATFAFAAPAAPADFVSRAIPLATGRPFAVVELPRGVRAKPLDAEERAAYAVTQLQSGSETRNGLLLPAPALAGWDLTIPPDSELRFAPGAIADGEASHELQGFDLSVEVQDEAGTHQLWSRPIRDAAFHGVRVDLSAFGGRRVRLQLRTSAPRHTPRELHFVAEPVVARLSEQPIRILLIFIDTLRPDHLGLYGYERNTSPAIDALAERSVVFEAARSVAPWTLPSARSLLTGQLPDRYGSVPTLQEQLREQGFATAMFAGNFYLDRAFDMHLGWDLMRQSIAPPATEQTALARDWLKAQRGRDALLLVHYMEPHLPYSEPESYRRLFAGDTPAPLAPDFELRGDVYKLPHVTPAVQQYLRDRYDNNIRYVDDQLALLLGELGERDIVVIFSDHGEEFWDHGGFEHGHSLYDELLRVPLLIHAPGLESRRVGEAVSLMDIAPTVLDLLGLPHGDMRGVSLLGAARSEASDLERLRDRDLAFGWPLYGSERWGLLQGQQKQLTSAGRVERYDLQRDPGETTDRIDDPLATPDEALREGLGAALDRNVVSALRLHVSRAQWELPEEDLTVTLHVPGGIASAWLGAEPLAHSSTALRFDGETLRAVWRARYRGEREVFIVPKQSPARVAAQVSGNARLGAAGFEAQLQPYALAYTGLRLVSGVRLGDGRRVSLGVALAPGPRNDARELSADHPELRAQLRALGYEAGPETDEPAEPADEAP